MNNTNQDLPQNFKTSAHLNDHYFRKDGDKFIHVFCDEQIGIAYINTVKEVNNSHIAEEIPEEEFDTKLREAILFLGIYKYV